MGIFSLPLRLVPAMGIFFLPFRDWCTLYGYILSRRARIPRDATRAAKMSSTLFNAGSTLSRGERAAGFHGGVPSRAQSSRHNVRPACNPAGLQAPPVAMRAFGGLVRGLALS
eukprot:853444-Prorocentrum_minimum.AAC.1